MKPGKRTTVSCWMALWGAVVLTGCQEGWKRETELPPEPAPQAAPALDPVLSGTIGSYAALGSVDTTLVRGFGLVIGLGDAGSSDCPTSVREHLIDYFNKRIAAGRPTGYRPRFSPQRLIDSRDTAVVEILGMVPPGAPRNTRFDLQVEAIAGTETRSLHGGLLLPSELRLYDVAVSGKGMLSGATVAYAHGPVFTNPFVSDPRSTTASDPRRGFVLGGGRTTDERNARLLLMEPSYSMARRIERRINQRFGHSPKVAESISRGNLVLHTPPQYADKPDLFIRLAPYLYLQDHVSFTERKMRELVDLAARPEADCERIALVWEGIGRTTIPQIQPLYTHESPALSFHAARTGLRLRDVTALPIVAEIAANPEQPYRLLAIRELGECHYPQAAVKLAPLLDDDDQEVRIAAYDALLSQRHPRVRTVRFPNALDPNELNLILDVIETSGRPLIYVRRTRAPRVAVFGERMPLVLPVFYNHPEDCVTINARNETDDDVTVFSRAPRSGLSEKIVIPPRVVDLIVALADVPEKDEADRLRGIGLTYSQVVQVLATLCQDGTIPAEFVLEQTSLTELLGPQPFPDRPEADEPENGSDDAGVSTFDEPLLPPEPPAEREQS
ncbi:MAG: flagellar basal body P-ring protein FlgI [Planctomycetes bacterium]|nr:flagellar basal body P-ring protein FlgI [Planctomycetota bacterium]